MAERIRLASFADVERLLPSVALTPPRLGGPFTVGQMLAHCAQSVRCSFVGYPQLRSTLFRATIGRFALRKFLRQGYMSHDRAAPIPGAPAIATTTTVGEGVEALREAMAAFRAHDGPFAPHLAFGTLSREEYERVHAMHLADHLSLSPTSVRG